MPYTSQKTLTFTTVSSGVVRAGLIDPSVQTYPQKEVLDRQTVRYEPPDERVLAPNVDDQGNPGIDIEPWSEW